MSATPAEPKAGLHPGNPHRFRYDFPALIASSPDLASFVQVNRYGGESVDFADPSAVKTLNRALLRHYYGIEWWDIPPGYLCPPIPGRADYIHHAADLLKAVHGGIIPTGPSVRVLDVGVGANCVYPIIASRTFGWKCTGSDTDPVSVKSAQAIVDANPLLAGLIDIRHQSSPDHYFRGIVDAGDRYDLVVCNPPFHASAAEAAEATGRKLTNLGGKGGRGKGEHSAPLGLPRGKGTMRTGSDQPRNQRNPLSATLNFGGQSNELWCPGGEVSFIRSMIAESVLLPETCLWYTCLISRSASLPAVYQALDKAAAVQVCTIDMAQGQKSSRFVAWTFLSRDQQAAWALGHWR